MARTFKKDIQYYKFCLYGFFKNLRFFDAFLILFFLEKGLVFFQIGVLYAIREISINILEIPAGVMADAFGRRRSMITSFVFYIISFVTFFFSSNYYIFIVAMLCYALGDAFRTGTHKAMIFEYLKRNNWKDQKVYYYGHTRSWSQMGSAVSSIIAAFIIIYSGEYKYIFIFSVIPYIFNLILLSSYQKSLDGNVQKADFKKLKTNFIAILNDFAFSFKSGKNLRAIGNLSLHSGFHKALKDYLQPILQTLALSIPIFIGLQEKQRTAILVGLIYFVVYFLSSYASKMAGTIIDRAKHIQRALNVTILIGFTIILFSGLFYHWGFILGAILLYISLYIVENLRNPAGVAHVSEVYDEKILATALSANSQAKSIIAAIVAPLIGYFADTFGVGIALSIVSGIAILLAPAYLLKNGKI